MEYSLPDYIEYVPLDDDRAVLSGPVSRKELRGDAVAVLEAALPHLRDGVTIEELATELDIPHAKAESLIGTLTDSGEVLPGDDVDVWTWLSETPAQTREEIETATVGVLSSGDRTPVSLDVLDTTEIDDVAAIPTDDPGLDALLTVTSGERPDFHRTVLDRTYDAGVPWLPVRLTGSEAVVGPLTVPHETSCYNCYFERHVASDRRPDARVLEIQQRSERRSVPPYHDAARRLLTAMAEIELLSEIGDYGHPRTRGGVVTADVRSAGCERSRVLKLPGCEVCGRN